MKRMLGFLEAQMMLMICICRMAVIYVKYRIFISTDGLSCRHGQAYFHMSRTCPIEIARLYTLGNVEVLLLPSMV